MESVRDELIRIFGRAQWNWILRDESNSEPQYVTTAPKARHGTKVEQAKPQWVTNKYPISEKKFLDLYFDTSQILGVRFNKYTCYGMIDIDNESLYHPSFGDYQQFKALLFALEDIGLTDYLAIQSSDSGGIHLYFPFNRDIKSWNFANRLKSYLVEKGFQVQPGQLELFPNPKSYDSLYNGHRLPMQAGSYLLDSDFEPYQQSILLFLEQWQEIAENHDYRLLNRFLESDEFNPKVKHNNKPQTQNTANTTNTETLEEEFEQVAKGKGIKVSVIERELIAQIKEGITHQGQTNDFLLNLTRRLYICGWANADKLPEKIREVASKTTGIENISEESWKDLFEGNWGERLTRWAVTNFKPYGKARSEKKKPERKAPTNEERAKDAFNRINEAVKSTTKDLSEGLTNLKKEICKKAKCSMRTLNAHWNSILENFQPPNTNSVSDWSSPVDEHSDTSDSQVDVAFFSFEDEENAEKAEFRVEDRLNSLNLDILSPRNAKTACGAGYSPEPRSDWDIANDEIGVDNQEMSQELTNNHQPLTKEERRAKIEAQKREIEQIKEQQAKLHAEKIQKVESELQSIKQNPLSQRFHQALVTEDVRQVSLCLKSVWSKSAFLLKLPSFTLVVNQLSVVNLDSD